jgi:hypothetical protein
MSPREDTFFRVEYRRHSNFASGESDQSTGTTAAMGRRNIQTTIARAGDLLSQVYMHAEFSPIVPTVPAQWSAVNFVGLTDGLGYAMIDEIVCLIGNKEFDRQDGEYMFMREQLAAKPNRQISQAAHYFGGVQAQAAINSLKPVELNVPLQFWFNNHVEQSISVIGLYWHDIQVSLSLKTQAEMMFTGGAGLPGGYTGGALTDLHFVCNFQYLDKPERELFANQKLEQVFVQHQTLGEESWAAADTVHTSNIRMNHPITDLMWAPRLVSNTALNDWFNYDGPVYVPWALGPVVPAAESYLTAQIFLNNQQRTLPLTAEYLRQIPQHRSQERISVGHRIAGYCFGAKVNDILHTGSANFSRYDNAQIRFTLHGAVAPAWSTTALGAAATVRIHARNFQLNKTSIGMMGIKFAA